MLTEVNGTETTVMGLTPAVYYTFFVTAENAVSSQDPNINIRSANVTATTEEGGRYTCSRCTHVCIYMYRYICTCF